MSREAHVRFRESAAVKSRRATRPVAESFFHTLKTRLIYQRKYNTSEELNRDLYWYIEVYYNRVRKHSANNWLTPDEKERKYYELGNAA